MRRTIFVACFALLSFACFSQVSISTDSSLADSSAILDIKSTNRGVLLPRLTSVQRAAINAPANGLLVFDSTSSSIWVYKQNAGWTELGAHENLPTTSPASYSEQNLATHTWEKVSNRVFPTGWRDGMAATVYKDTILLLGGWDGAIYSDIYASADGGLTWELFGSIPNPGHAMTIVHGSDDYHYLIGNDHLNTPAARKSVYRTKDFRSWELRTADAEWGDRMLSAAVAHDGALYVLGGQTDLFSSTGIGDVWKSTDGGATWQQVAGNLSFLGKNIYSQVVSFEGRIWVVGGGRYDHNPLARTFEKAVYSSADGATWKRETDIPVNGKTYANVVVWDGKLWLIAGSFDSYNTREVAYMDKKGEWHDFNVESNVLTETHAAAVVVWRDQVLRLSGNMANDVWRLTRKEAVAMRKPESGNWDALTIKSPFADGDRKAIVWNNNLGKVGQIDVRYNANSGHSALAFGNLLNTNAADATDRLLLYGNGDSYLNGRLAIHSPYFSGNEALKIGGSVLVDAGNDLSLRGGQVNLQAGGSMVLHNRNNTSFTYLANTAAAGSNLTVVDNGKELVKMEQQKTTVSTSLQVGGSTWLQGALEGNVSTAADADYTIADADYMVLLPDITQSRTLVLPTPPVGKVRRLVLRNNNTAAAHKWQFSTPVKGNGEELTHLPNAKLITLYGTNGTWYSN